MKKVQWSRMILTLIIQFQLCTSNTHDDYSRMDGHLYYTTSELSEKYTETLHKRIALEVAVDVDILVLRVCTFLELERDEAFKRRFRKNAPPKPLYTVQTTTGKMSRVHEKDKGFHILFLQISLMISNRKK